MRIVVLGGCGNMGRGVVDDLMARSDAQVVIADYRLQHAQEYASRLGARATATAVDANDAGSLAAVLDGADAAVGAIGPFYRYAHTLAAAAVRAGVHYVDLCDDYGPVEALLALDDEASAADVTVITGLGWTPGITNLMCRAGAAQLDRVDEIKVAWAGGGQGPSGLAVLMHVFYAFGGQVPTYRDGRWTEVAAGSGREVVDFGTGIGPLTVFHCGHPEPLTLPRYMNTRSVSLKGTLTPAWNTALSDSFVRLWMWLLYRVGLTRTHERIEKLSRAIYRMEQVFGTVDVPYAAARADVAGSCEGHPCTRSFRVKDKMQRLTGIPAAIGALLLAQGRVEPRGAFAPEGCLEPQGFFRELAKRHISIEEVVNG
jgi:saccharopine dehydrogenase-like NADP-dependent oxidoreductase